MIIFVEVKFDEDIQKLENLFNLNLTRGISFVPLEFLTNATRRNQLRLPVADAYLTQ